MKKHTKNKDSVTTFILILVLIIGLSLLLYPTFSNAWNQSHQTHVIQGYTNAVANMDEENYEEIWQEAVAYNQSLLHGSDPHFFEDKEMEVYLQKLSLPGQEVMGYIEIPKIDTYLPIYHGTDNAVLQVGIGHVEWSSLPTGGESTHCVLSGHRGLPSARLFTDLDQLVVGDLFMLNVLDEVLTYEIDQILIVEPENTDALLIEEGKDLCTLVTCTPYGINTHRLLVRGHRVENLEEAQVVRVTADAMIIEKTAVVPFVLAPILLVMLIILLFSTRKKRNRRNEK